jgi:Glyoxalase-like domain
MSRGLDHIVLATRDLAGAAAHYRAMGFLVGARNRHPWGTENHIVQLPGAFLELVGVGEGAEIVPPRPGNFSFAWMVAHSLETNGNCFPMLVVESRDALADKQVFDDAGIGNFEPFSFERLATRPDGTQVRVAFTLAFAVDAAMPEAAFFACQHHEPQNFWNPDFQQHPNGASRLNGVVLLSQTPASCVPFFEALTESRALCAGARNMAIVTPRGSIEAMRADCYTDVLGLTPEVSGSNGARLLAFKIAAPLQALVERLDNYGIPFIRHRKHLAVAAKDNFGAALVFEEPQV